MRTLKVLTFFVCQLFASMGHGQSIDSWDFAVLHKTRCSQGDMREMNECLAHEYQAVDSKLNNIYKKLNKALADATLLKRSQIDWIRFRDSECKFRSSGYSEDGSGYPYTMNACLIDVTLKRIYDLEVISPCLDCPPFKNQHYK